MARFWVLEDNLYFSRYFLSRTGHWSVRDKNYLEKSMGHLNGNQKTEHGGKRRESSILSQFTKIHSNLKDSRYFNLLRRKNLAFKLPYSKTETNNSLPSKGVEEVFQGGPVRKCKGRWWGLGPKTRREVETALEVPTGTLLRPQSWDPGGTRDKADWWS